MSEEFEIGEVVMLKSGGPEMTVTGVGQETITGENSVWCIWFDQRKLRQTGTFPVAAVVKIA